ncbi:AAA family ATPase [Frigidibacter sp. MR17.14]|uniref:AAA family ATPase n=1 Tax=Frigidibacter sp. MR17.14 TaxID=3126509 RepID=UPI003012C441
MTRVPFVLARFPDPQLTKLKIVERLERFWVKYHAATIGYEYKANLAEDGRIDFEDWERRSKELEIPEDIKQRIRRRAAILAERNTTGTPLSDVPEKDVRRLEPVKNGVDLIRIPSEHRADEIAAAVHAEFPWFGPVTEWAWHCMRRSVRTGEKGFCLPPLLLNGPAGIGKSSWARLISEQLGLPSVALDATTESAGFGVVGLQAGWGSSRTGRPVNVILQRKVGNPLVVIDEIDKVSTAHSEKGTAHSLTDSLLPLLEPATARGWDDPYFRVPLDMSWISWVLTSNYLAMIPEPLKSRCQIFELRPLTGVELADFVCRDGKRRGLPRDMIQAIAEAFRCSRSRQLAPSLRTAVRMLNAAERALDHPVLH